MKVRRSCRICEDLLAENNEFEVCCACVSACEAAANWNSVDGELSEQTKLIIRLAAMRFRQNTQEFNRTQTRLQPVTVGKRINCILRMSFAVLLERYRQSPSQGLPFEWFQEQISKVAAFHFRMVRKNDHQLLRRIFLGWIASTYCSPEFWIFQAERPEHLSKKVQSCHDCANGITHADGNGKCLVCGSGLFGYRPAHASAEQLPIESDMFTYILPRPNSAPNERRHLRPRALFEQKDGQPSESTATDRTSERLVVQRLNCLMTNSISMRARSFIGSQMDAQPIQVISMTTAAELKQSIISVQLQIDRTKWALADAVENDDVDAVIRTTSRSNLAVSFY